MDDQYKAMWRDWEGVARQATNELRYLNSSSDNVASWILELDGGYGIPWQGNYSSWLEQKRARLATEEKAESARLRTLQRELDWATSSGFLLDTLTAQVSHSCDTFSENPAA